MKKQPNTSIPGMSSPFQTSGYIVKKNIPNGDNANFNNMPPGMDIMNQDLLDVRDMPFKTIIAGSYPGDGWSDD